MTVTYGKLCNGVFWGGAHCVHVSECVRGWMDGGAAAGAVEAPGVLLLKPLDRFKSPPSLLLRPINQGLAIDQKYAPTFNLIILCTE